MQPKVYIETTIASYLTARPSRDLIVAAHQEITRDWWDTRRLAFDLYVSDLVIQEIQEGDPVLASRRIALLTEIPVLTINDDILTLARDMVFTGPIPRKAAGDAAHIACAAIYGCEYLLTWNCRHIANAELQRGIRRVVEGHGYDAPSLCTPEELMGDERELSR